MNIAITGATGFIGKYLCRYLAQRGHKVTAIVRDSSKANLLTDKIRVEFGDVTKPDSLISAFSGSGVVIHLAALFNRPEASRNNYIAVNVEGTRNVIEAAIKNGIGHVVHCSTIGVATGAGSMPFSEDTPYSPIKWDKYETSKCEGEKLALEFHGRKGLSITVLRPAQVYGPGDRSKAKFYRMVKKGIMINPGNTFKHPIYIEDLCEAFELAIRNDNLGGRIFIIGNEKPIKLTDLITIVSDKLGVKKPKVYLPALPMTMVFTMVESLCEVLGVKPPLFRRSMDFFTKSVVFDVSKARNELGFKDKTDMIAGVSQTADWYVKEGLI